MTDIATREQSEELLDLFMSDDPGFQKEAVQRVEDYTRKENIEDSFLTKILEPTEFRREDLIPGMNGEAPYQLFEYEMDAPFPVAIDYGEGAPDFVPRADFYPIRFHKLTSPRAVFDLMDIQMYKQDLRHVLSDKMNKHLVVMRDTTAISHIRSVLGTVDQVLPWCGQAMHVDTKNPLTYTAWARASNKIRETDFNIEPSKALLNNLRQADLKVMAPNEFQGTEQSVSMMIEGKVMTKLDNIQLMLTSKRNLVPFADTFWFAAQEYLGRFIQWIPPTMIHEKKGTQITFQTYMAEGMTFANPAGMAIQRFL